VRTLKEQVNTAKASSGTTLYRALITTPGDVVNLPAQHLVNPYLVLDTSGVVHIDPAQQVEAALKAYREAPDAKARQRAADALEQAVKKLREQPKKPEKPSNPGGSK
jgi:hypothetical protein